MRSRKLWTLFTYASIGLAQIAAPNTARAQVIPLPTGSTPEYGGSGWMDLSPPMDFLKGERLRMLIGGSATKIVVRLLPNGAKPETSAGVIGTCMNIPKSRLIEITLEQDRKQVIQISVHGGPSPWGKFPCSPSNGPATLESVQQVKPQK